jgi:hypothetical protein
MHSLWSRSFNNCYNLLRILATELALELVLGFAQNMIRSIKGGEIPGRKFSTWLYKIRSARISDGRIAR